MPKILIIRFSSIGDIVLTSPVVRCVKEQLGAEVHFLTKKSFRNILAAHPQIDKIYTIERQVKEVLPELGAEQYDYILDLHKNIRSLQVRWALQGKYLTFDKLNFPKWLLVHFKINRLPEVHIVDRYMASLEKIGVHYDGKGLNYYIPPAEELDLKAFFPNDFYEQCRTAGFIAFAIGAAHATKRLPFEKIVAICLEAPLPVVLVGGPGEEEVGMMVVSKLGKEKAVRNTCGKLSLHQSASLVRQAALVLSHDTGMMHIAAAFKKPIISVWGNTVPEFGMYPFYPEGMDRNKTVEVKRLACRPCSKIGSEECPKGHFKCMKKIPTEGFFEDYSREELQSPRE